MSTTPKALYAGRDPRKLEPHYAAHMVAMTHEDLYEKSEIACELAWRDQQIAELRAQVEALTKHRDGLQVENRWLERDRDDWRTRARVMLEHQRGEAWYWQGDGQDHLESLCNSLPVVIRADQMRGLLAAQALSRPQEPVHGDVLPPIGSRVFIRHGRDDDAHACTVTGYYAWGDLGHNKHLHRVFVRLVYEGTTTPNSRMLCDCYPTAEAALAASTPEQPLTRPAVPEIDYDELIAACYRITKRPQGTPGCVHFKAGAEWFRSVMLAAAPQPEAAQKGGE